MRAHTPLAKSDADHYSPGMWSEPARRLLVLLLSVALATGITMRVAHADGVDMTAAAMTTGMSMDGKCHGCPGEDKAMPPTACFAFCGGVVAALPSLAVALEAPGIDGVAPAQEPVATGHAAAPDPYPPRPISLS